MVIMQKSDKGNRKYVFVCGLPRSGTSVLGRNIGRLEDCTDFKNTGVGMDEGQFLQDVYPAAHVFGGAGRFGFDPCAHRTETSSLLTAENVARLRASWHAHWDDLRGKNSGESSYDALSASSVSQLLLRGHQAASRAREYCRSEVESERDIALQYV
jgi:hypothetical protein